MAAKKSAKSKPDRKMWKVVPLTYTDGVPAIWVRGLVAAEYVQSMFVGSGHDTMIYPEGYYPEFRADGTLG